MAKTPKKPRRRRVPRSLLRHVSRYGIVNRKAGSPSSKHCVLEMKTVVQAQATSQGMPIDGFRKNLKIQGGIDVYRFPNLGSFFREGDNTTTDVLFNAQGTLYWNGQPVVTGSIAQGGQDLTVTDGSTSVSSVDTITVSGGSVRDDGDGDITLTVTPTGDISSVSLTGDSGGEMEVATGDADFTIAGGDGLSTAGSGTTLTLTNSDHSATVANTAAVAANTVAIALNTAHAGDDGSDHADVATNTTNTGTNTTNITANTAAVALNTSHRTSTSDPHGTLGADSVNDTHIDWGTGTNEVNLDDVPDGATHGKTTTAQVTAIGLNSTHRALTDEHIDWTADQGATNIDPGNYTDTNTQLTTEEVQDIVGGMLTGNTATRGSLTYQDGDGTIDLVVDDMTSDTQLTTEEVQDIVGGMLTGNTETNIAVTYQDGDGTIDFASTDTNTQLTDEQVQDIVGGMLTGNTETRGSLVYQDGDGTIDLVVDDMTADNQLTDEQVQDIVGAMFTSNTETRIAATYQDGDGTIDLVVDDMTGGTTYSGGDGVDVTGTTISIDPKANSGVEISGGEVTVNLGASSISGRLANSNILNDSISFDLDDRNSVEIDLGTALTLEGAGGVTTSGTGTTVTVSPPETVTLEAINDDTHELWADGNGDGYYATPIVDIALNNLDTMIQEPGSTFTTSSGAITIVSVGGTFNVMACVTVRLGGQHVDYAGSVIAVSVTIEKSTNAGGTWTAIGSPGVACITYPPTSVTVQADATAVGTFAIAGAGHATDNKLRLMCSLVTNSAVTPGGGHGSQDYGVIEVRAGAAALSVIKTKG